MTAYRRLTDQEWREQWQEYWSRARQLAAGHWDSVLRVLAPQVSPALDGLGKRHVPCPVHGGKDGFRMYKDFHETGGGHCNTCGAMHDGFEILKWANGWTAREAVEAVTGHFTGGDGKIRPKPRTAPPPPTGNTQEENENLALSLNRAWLDSIPVTARDAEPLRLYLRKRGLKISPPEALRFHPSLVYFDVDQDRIIGRFPAMIAMVTGPDGQPVTIHRTYLTPDGRKANVPSPKKLMSYPDVRTVTGGAIQLCPHGRVLAVAEGIETALAAMEGTGIPTWPTVNAVMLENFVPPPSVEQLIVFADKDRPSRLAPNGPGQQAASRLVQRAWKMGIRATAIVPKGEIPEGEKSLDWLDVLRNEGPQGIPTLEAVRRSMLKVA
ncbi:toprim domain-containing protein [Acidovorax sp. sic0104]|uniref:DUF7146 domain-containing protein n=1 Tax=Acidovorax sp. sic0104 TaxID=2854784 RepID=UPI001C45DB50|nr:toprim domain-containing protein [Acidovorax sp. sic0104]MBV7542149.1 toprim domain-containing protein [Acidovorax sp. sic0104]